MRYGVGSENRHNLDSRKRVFVPARIRDLLGRDLLVNGNDDTKTANGSHVGKTPMVAVLSHHDDFLIGKITVYQSCAESKDLVFEAYVAERLVTSVDLLQEGWLASVKGGTFLKHLS